MSWQKLELQRGRVETNSFLIHAWKLILRFLNFILFCRDNCIRCLIGFFVYVNYLYTHIHSTEYSGTLSADPFSWDSSQHLLSGAAVAVFISCGFSWRLVVVSGQVSPWEVHWHSCQPESRCHLRRGSLAAWLTNWLVCWPAGLRATPF